MKFEFCRLLAVRTLCSVLLTAAEFWSEITAQLSEPVYYDRHVPVSAILLWRCNRAILRFLDNSSTLNLYIRANFSQSCTKKYFQSCYLKTHSKESQAWPKLSDMPNRILQLLNTEYFNTSGTNYLHWHLKSNIFDEFLNFCFTWNLSQIWRDILYKLQMCRKRSWLYNWYISVDCIIQ